MEDAIDAIDAIKEEISKKTKEFEQIDEYLIGTVIGTSQALDELRQAIDKIDACLDERKYEKASSLGYSDLAHGFISLQRCLSNLQAGANNIEKLVSDVAITSNSHCYEATAPYVIDKLQCMKPRLKK